MPYVNIPNDLSKIKTKISFNLTKCQLVCFSIGAAMDILTYLLSREAISNTGTLFGLLVIMLPAFVMTMYEKDGVLFEKALRNILHPQFLRPDMSPCKTQTSMTHSQQVIYGAYKRINAAFQERENKYHL